VVADRSYERSERIYAAMLSRGFDGRIRTMRAESFGATQLIAAIAFICYLLTVLGLTVAHMQA